MGIIDGTRYYYIKIINNNNNNQYYIMDIKYVKPKEQLSNFKYEIDSMFDNNSPYIIKNIITDNEITKRIWSGNYKNILTTSEYNLFMNYLNNNYPHMFKNGLPKLKWELYGNDKKYIILEFNQFYLKKQNKNKLNKF